VGTGKAEWLELSGTHQLVVNTNGVNIFEEAEYYKEKRRICNSW